MQTCQPHCWCLQDITLDYAGQSECLVGGGVLGMKPSSDARSINQFTIAWE